MAEAKKELTKNYMASLSIKKEPYELMNDANLSAAGLLTEAGKESERGAASTAGRIFMGAQENAGQIRTAMGQELSDLELKTAQESSRLRDVGVQLNLEEAAGAQQAAADAQLAAANATTQGFQSVISGVQQGVENLPLYSEYYDEGRKAKKEAKKAAKLKKEQEATKGLNVGVIYNKDKNDMNATVFDKDNNFNQNPFLI